MAKTKISLFDAVASNNTDINSVNVAEGCPPSGINNSIRELASLLKKQEVGTDAMTSPDIDGGTIDGATIGANSASTGAFTNLSVSGAFTSQGIDDNADATAITIDSSELIGINNTSPSSSFSGARNLVIGGGSGHTGMTILSGTSSRSSIEFSDGTGSDATKTAGGIRYYHDSNYMRFNTNGGSERMRINASGNVGLGTSSPEGRLTLGVNTTSSDGLYINNSASGGGELDLVSLGTSYNAHGAGAGEVWLYSPDNINIGGATGGSNVVKILGGGSERMRIASDGKIGINTTSPSSGVEISNTGVAIGSGCTASNTGVGNVAIGHASHSTATGASSFVFGREMTVSGNHSFGVALSDQNGLNVSQTNFMSIMGGQVGVGVSSLSLHQMAVHGATGGNATFKVANTSSSGNTTTYLSFMDGSGANSVNSAHFQGFNGANNHYLLGNGTTTFTSDEIAKKNIETTRDGYLEDLAKLRVVKYNWKEDEDGTDKELGLIAQEVEKVFPKLVMLDIDPQIEEKDKKKMIKLSVLPLMLLKALQEANTKITALEARITTLEGA